jgi:hypothetical protein
VEPQCSLHSARIAAVKQALATSLPRTWPCPPRQRTAWAERSGLPAPPSRGLGGAARGACVAGRARGPRARWSRTMSWPRSAPRRPRRRWQAQAALHSCHRVPARRGGQGGCPPRGPTAPSALANGPTQAQVPTWPDRACLGEAASRAALTRMCQCRWCRHWPAPGLSIGWELVNLRCCAHRLPDGWPQRYACLQSLLLAPTMPCLAQAFACAVSAQGASWLHRIDRPLRGRRRRRARAQRSQGTLRYGRTRTST